MYSLQTCKISTGTETGTTPGTTGPTLSAPLAHLGWYYWAGLVRCSAQAARCLHALMDSPALRSLVPDPLGAVRRPRRRGPGAAHPPRRVIGPAQHIPTLFFVFLLFCFFCFIFLFTFFKS
jgi:hypothetical protein